MVLKARKLLVNIYWTGYNFSYLVLLAVLYGAALVSCFATFTANLELGIGALFLWNLDEEWLISSHLLSR